MSRILTSQILNPGRGAGRSRPSLRDAGTSVGMCAACMCYGLRDEAREQGMRAETRELHDRATHLTRSRTRVTAYPFQPSSDPTHF
eukprot:5385296-Prymnesium_polylepis.1